MMKDSNAKIQIPCLPLIQERFHHAIREQLPQELYYGYPEYRFVGIFEQVWPSKLLEYGQGDYEDDNPVPVYTVVIKETHTDIYGVFFGEHLSYAIEKPNSAFMLDLQHQTMNPLSKMSEYKD